MTTPLLRPNDLPEGWKRVAGIRKEAGQATAVPLITRSGTDSRRAPDDLMSFRRSKP